MYLHFNCNTYIHFTYKRLNMQVKYSILVYPGYQSMNSRREKVSSDSNPFNGSFSSRAHITQWITTCMLPSGVDCNSFENNKMPMSHCSCEVTISLLHSTRAVGCVCHLLCSCELCTLISHQEANIRYTEEYIKCEYIDKLLNIHKHTWCDLLYLMQIISPQMIVYFLMIYIFCSWHLSCSTVIPKPQSVSFQYIADWILIDRS